MMYSCFDDKSGSYRYFKDSRQLAINADLPIPRLPQYAGDVGVPAIEAGRSLPSDAQPVGSGFFAQGQIVQCDGGGLGSVDDTVEWFKQDGWKWAVGILAAVIVVKHVL